MTLAALTQRLFRRSRPGRHRPGATNPDGRHAHTVLTPRGHLPSVLVEHTLPLNRDELRAALDADRPPTPPRGHWAAPVDERWAAATSDEHQLVRGHVRELHRMQGGW